MYTKYSYNLAYINSKNQIFGNATGFLVKKNGKPYLFTNVHVLFGLKVDGLIPDVNLIPHKNYKISLLYKTLNGESKLFDIEIDKTRKKYSNLLFNKMLDVFPFPLPKLPSDATFHFINLDFELSSETKSKNLVAVGYVRNFKLPEEDINHISQKTIIGKTIGDSTESGRRILTNLIIEPGMSGSPIFTIKNDKVSFYGIGDGYNPGKGTSFITRIYGSNVYRSYFE
jgi:hypothetical protein